MNTDAAPRDETELDARLSRPTDDAVAALAELDGDVMVLGAGGKMGPTLARMARQAFDRAGIPRTGAGARRVYAVARFRNNDVANALESQGVIPLRADATDRTALAALPEAANVLYLVGQKFGTTDDPVGTWAQNVVAAVHSAERFASSRIVAFSTGNVYPHTPVTDGGARETHPLTFGGEYAASCVGRERVFDHASRARSTRVLHYRLCYACDLRYGVVTDLALRVLHGEPVALATGYVNVIWQRDANALALRALALATSPATALNVSGPVVSVRALAEGLAARLNVQPAFDGEEHGDALVVNVNTLQQTLPHDALPLSVLLDWAAEWVQRGGRVLGKPTRFDVRDGRY